MENRQDLEQKLASMEETLHSFIRFDYSPLSEDEVRALVRLVGRYKQGQRLSEVENKIMKVLTLKAVTHE